MMNFCFLGIVNNTGMNPKPDIRDYITQEWIQKCPLYMDVLKEEIFLCVLPIATAAQTVGAGRRNMIQYLHGKFQEYYTPGSNIYIDDSIVCFKGQLTFKSFK
jgi:hypothetical protein